MVIVGESSVDGVTSDDGESQSDVLSDGDSSGDSEQNVDINIKDWESYSTTEQDEFTSA